MTRKRENETSMGGMGKMITYVFLWNTLFPTETDIVGRRVVITKL